MYIYIYYVKREGVVANTYICYTEKYTQVTIVSLRILSLLSSNDSNRLYLWLSGHMITMISLLSWSLSNNTDEMLLVRVLHLTTQLLRQDIRLLRSLSEEQCEMLQDNHLSYIVYKNIIHNISRKIFVLKERLEPQRRVVPILLQKCLAFVEIITSQSSLKADMLPTNAALIEALSDTTLVGIVSLVISMLLDTRTMEGEAVPMESLPSEVFSIAGVGVMALINMCRIDLDMVQVSYAYVYILKCSLSILILLTTLLYYCSLASAWYYIAAGVSSCSRTSITLLRY